MTPEKESPSREEIIAHIDGLIDRALDNPASWGGKSTLEPLILALLSARNYAARAEDDSDELLLSYRQHLAQTVGPGNASLVDRLLALGDPPERVSVVLRAFVTATRDRDRPVPMSSFRLVFPPGWTTEPDSREIFVGDDVQWDEDLMLATRENLSIWIDGGKGLRTFQCCLVHDPPVRPETGGLSRRHTYLMRDFVDTPAQVQAWVDRAVIIASKAIPSTRPYRESLRAHGTRLDGS